MASYVEETESLISRDSSQPGGMLTSCEGSSVHSAPMAPSQDSAVIRSSSGEPHETPRHKLPRYSPRPSRKSYIRAQSLTTVQEEPGLFAGQFSGRFFSPRSQSVPNLHDRNFDGRSSQGYGTGSDMSTERPPEQRKRIIVMHTSADENPARQLHKKMAKGLKSMIKDKFNIWDDVCPGGIDFRRAEERIDAEPTVLVFCVTVGFMDGYRASRNTPTTTNAMYNIMERALQSPKHYVIPVRSSTSPRLTEEDICKVLDRKCLFEDDRRFDEKIVRSLVEAGVQRKKTSFFSRNKKYIKF